MSDLHDSSQPGDAPSQPSPHRDTPPQPTPWTGAGPGQTTAPWQPAAPGPWQTAPASGFRFDRARWLPTTLVAAVIAAVVLGGLALDGVIPAPSAGTQNIGGSVTITASSGWVLVSSPSDRSQGIALQKGDATLTAQVLSEDFSGSSTSMMDQVRAQLDSQVAQISYGDQHHAIVGGNDSTYVLFEAIVSGTGSSGQMGTVDGELVCMVVSGNAVVLEVAAPQGDLQYVTDDVAAMVKTVRAG